MLKANGECLLLECVHMKLWIGFDVMAFKVKFGAQQMEIAELYNLQ